MEHIVPGPVDGSLLIEQGSHISSSIWNNPNELEDKVFKCRHHFIYKQIPDVVANKITEAGFGNVLQIPNIEINQHLITALVARWRPETHTFHFPYGEATVTLEDVCLQLGLPIEGNVVAGPTNIDWVNYCRNFLGHQPQDDDIKGNSVKLTWLDSIIHDIPKNAPDNLLEQQARAHILRIIGGLLMPDTSGSRVNLMYLYLLQDLPSSSTYSWGSAVLACLYRGLDRAAIKKNQKQIASCLILLQSWVYDRIPALAPQYEYISDTEVQDGVGFPLVTRWARPSSFTSTPGHNVELILFHLDRLHVTEFVWMPYQKPEIIRLQIPNAHDVCRALVPLISYAILEWHPIDRVKRQFGFHQEIPRNQRNPDFDRAHKKDMRGNPGVNWADYHHTWINEWNQRHDKIINDVLCNTIVYENSQYMRWYARVTRRYITQSGALAGGMNSFVQSMLRTAMDGTRSGQPQQYLREIILSCTDMTKAINEVYPSPFSSQNELEGPSDAYAHHPPQPPPQNESEGPSDACATIDFIQSL